MHVKELVNALSVISQEELKAISDLIYSTFGIGNKLLLCGNGGSMCEAKHMATELVGRYQRDRKGYPAISLSSDSDLTALANDFGYINVFSRQVEAFGKVNDLLIVFSSSGNSPNIVAALNQAKTSGIRTVAFLGKGGGECRYLADMCLIVNSAKTSIVQECHLIALHEVCDLVDIRLTEFRCGGYEPKFSKHEEMNYRSTAQLVTKLELESKDK